MDGIYQFCWPEKHRKGKLPIKMDGFVDNFSNNEDRVMEAFLPLEIKKRQGKIKEICLSYEEFAKACKWKTGYVKRCIEMLDREWPNKMFLKKAVPDTNKFIFTVTNEFFRYLIYDKKITTTYRTRWCGLGQPSSDINNLKIESRIDKKILELTSNNPLLRD